MKTRWFIMLLTGAALIASIAVAVENKGAEEIDIDGGSRGNIPFLHHTHQNRLTDCNICHAVFPQEQNALRKLKTSGDLQPKQVMTTLCISCHKAEKTAGNSAGPTTCSKCHMR
jgi:hypothetical protein